MELMKVFKAREEERNETQETTTEFGMDCNLECEATKSLLSLSCSIQIFRFYFKFYSTYLHNVDNRNIRFKSMRQLLKFLDLEGEDASTPAVNTTTKEKPVEKEKKAKTDMQQLKTLMGAVSSKITESKGWSKKMREAKTFLA